RRPSVRIRREQVSHERTRAAWTLVEFLVVEPGCPGYAVQQAAPGRAGGSTPRDRLLSCPPTVMFILETSSLPANADALHEALTAGLGSGFRLPAVSVGRARGPLPPPAGLAVAPR